MVAYVMYFFSYISRRDAVDGDVFGSTSTSMNAHDRHGEYAHDETHHGRKLQ